MSDPVEVYLIPQDDGGDCQNSQVPNDPDKAVGTVTCQRQGDGTTVVLVEATLRPDKTYDFYLKCIRLLGQLQTGDEGTCAGKFMFNDNEAGNTYAFDCYEQPPVSGDIYQSVTVNIS
jgi:hypothetical protein